MSGETIINFKMIFLVLWVGQMISLRATALAVAVYMLATSGQVVGFVAVAASES